MADTSEYVLSCYQRARNLLTRSLSLLSRPEPDYLEAIVCLSSALEAVTKVISYCDYKIVGSSDE